MADTQFDSNDHNKTPVNKSGKPIKAKKPIAPIRQRLMLTWLIWLAYRLLGLPILISIFNPSSPDIFGGVAWQALWLIPAVILTPWILRGRSPYALLVGSMLTLVYLGASGVVLFSRIYGSGWAEIVVYLIDFLLLLAVNVWLFILLKRLPSMNNVVKKPRS
ncbi:hypothetical protein [Psychrobacter sp.]|uniref:hypothetical protein n=1 Tax=Psychrobacter sp. TaxID=56811 RepID=UPI0026488FBC|nr:hypothetical protein [Psychrobacter sp.]MDN6276090.1 hypothetical protein [Psychrobacter sp.]MDN6308254.1 hypothetical protein [Psychrobacter sp.]